MDLVTSLVAAETTVAAVDITMEDAEMVAEMVVDVTQAVAVVDTIHAVADVDAITAAMITAAKSIVTAAEERGQDIINTTMIAEAI